jgi:Cu/Ag efflux protein CusF
MRSLVRTSACFVLVAFIVAAGGACAPESSPPFNAESSASVRPAGKKEFVFKGKVDAVDPAGKTLTVTNENIDGWMAPMTMVYKADNDAVYSKVKSGDQITARVYEGIEDTLYDVEVR